MADHPLRPATDRRLGGPLPRQLANQTQAHPWAKFFDLAVSSGISTGFPVLCQTQGQITYALLTRAPVTYTPKGASPLDLHVLGTPPAFVLSQDQTLRSRVVVLSITRTSKENDS